MTMKTQKDKKSNKNKRNVKHTAKIFYSLVIKGITQKDLAKELNVSKQAINRVINGKSKSARISNYIKEVLGV